MNETAVSLQLATLPSKSPFFHPSMRRSLGLNAFPLASTASHPVPEHPSSQPCPAHVSPLDKLYPSPVSPDGSPHDTGRPVVLFAGWTNSLYRPAFLVMFSPVTSTIVISIRGTLSVQDAVTGVY
jgi:hypothetical protein